MSSSRKSLPKSVAMSAVLWLMMSRGHPSGFGFGERVHYLEVMPGWVGYPRCVCSVNRIAPERVAAPSSLSGFTAPQPGRTPRHGRASCTFAVSDYGVSPTVPPSERPCDCRCCSQRDVVPEVQRADLFLPFVFLVSTQEAAVGECDLRFLMVNGESFKLRFPQTATICDVKQELIDKKPSELIDFLQVSAPGSPPPAKTEELRILHLGKFLEDAKTLQGKPAVLSFTFPDIAFRHFHGTTRSRSDHVCVQLVLEWLCFYCGDLLLLRCDFISEPRHRRVSRAKCRWVRL